ncbi:MAG: (Fe-S)-binding protein [Clostridioides sp.]|jgi:Fe-S oxidoreductase|nr:(Fe-S)-binding protein [Clostridioides sp.]
MEKLKLGREVLKHAQTQVDNCIDCKICFKVCPMMDKFGLSPKQIAREIVDEQAVDKLLPYSCMMCGLCEKVCPVDIDWGELHQETREEIFSNYKKKLNEIGYNGVKFHQMSSFCGIFSSTELNRDSKSIFLPGCSLTAYSEDLVNQTYLYLRQYMPNLSLVFECCANPTKLVGDKNGFEKYFSHIADLIANEQVDEIVVACPNCYKVINALSQDVKVSFIWEKIREFGLPTGLKGHYSDVAMSFALHDPCAIRYESGLQDDVRYVLKELGVKVNEFEFNRENTKCCGSGGMTRVTSPEISSNQSKTRADESKSDVIVSYCQSCCESFLEVGKPTLHVLDFIFNTNVICKTGFSQSNKSLMGKWVSRRKAVKNKKGC